MIQNIIALLLNAASTVVAAMLYRYLRDSVHHYPAVQWAGLQLHVIPKLHLGLYLVLSSLALFAWGQWSIRKHKRSLRIILFTVYVLSALPGFWLLNVYRLALPDIQMLNTFIHSPPDRATPRKQPVEKRTKVEQPAPPTTRMSSMQALGVANEAAISNGYALYMYSPADISYNSTSEQWSVTRKGTYTGSKGTKGKSIVVLINDNTGETTVSEILNNDGQQAGAAYPPQGVGSADP